MRLVRLAVAEILTLVQVGPCSRGALAAHEYGAERCDNVFRGRTWGRSDAALRRDAGRTGHTAKMWQGRSSRRFLGACA